MSARSSQKYLEQYAADGYTIFHNVLDKSLLALINRHLEQLCREQKPAPLPNLYARPVKDDLFWAALVAEKKLLDIAEIFIGSDIALFWANYVVKEPGERKPVLWHQDAPNWRLEPLEAVTLWLAVDDSTVESGCLKIIPGSHKDGLHPLEPAPAEETPNIFGWRTPPKFVREEESVDIVLKAGDVSVHHPLVIHGSHPNTSNRRRAGMSIRYIPTATRIAYDIPWSNALLLRGQAHPGINHYNKIPT